MHVFGVERCGSPQRKKSFGSERGEGAFGGPGGLRRRQEAPGSSRTPQQAPDFQYLSAIPPFQMPRVARTIQNAGFVEVIWRGDDLKVAGDDFTHVLFCHSYSKSSQHLANPGLVAARRSLGGREAIMAMYNIRHKRRGRLYSTLPFSVPPWGWRKKCPGGPRFVENL